jgi:hypothetical protein
MTTVLNVQSDAQTMLPVHWILAEDGFAVIDEQTPHLSTMPLAQAPDIGWLHTGVDAQERQEYISSCVGSCHA